MEYNRKPVWHKQESETAKSFLWFSRYLELGENRSLERLCLNYSKNIRYLFNLKNWCAKYEWVDRTSAYDEHIITEAMKLAEKEKIKNLAKARLKIENSMLNFAEQFEKISKVPLPVIKKDDQGNTIKALPSEARHILEMLKAILGESDKTEQEGININFIMPKYNENS